MSRKNQPKEKRLDNLSVVTSDKVWIKTGVDEKGHSVYKRNPDVVVFGRVCKNSSVYISNSNSKGTNHKYVDDFSNLNKKNKKEICDMFENGNKRVVYLVEKPSTLSAVENKNTIKKGAKKK